jgi:hypothetical protein
MKIGLVIQGPLLSGGFGGSNRPYGRTRAKAESLVNHDCIDTIRQNVLQGREYFDGIVLSLWEKDSNRIHEVEQITRNIIWSRDPTPNPPSIRKDIAGFPDFSVLNKIRQFYGTLQGAEYFKERNIDAVVKIRSDQSLDTELLFLEFKTFLEEKKKKYFVPYLNPLIPWSISDFYIGAKTEDLIEICYLMVSKKIEFHTNVHRDLFFKSAYKNYLINPPYNLADFFLNEDLANQSLIELVDKEMTNTWYPGSKKLYSSINWRGSQIIFDPSKTIFFGEAWKDLLKPKVSEKDNVNYDMALRFIAKNLNLRSLVFKSLKSKLRRKYSLIRSQISYALRVIGIRNY